MATDLRDMLSKEVGGVPIWVIVVAIGGGVGLYIRHRNKSSTTTTDTNTPQGVASLSDNSGAYGAIDPNTGIPYSLESSGLVGSTVGGGSADGGMGAYAGPSAAQEIQDVSGIIGAIQPLLGLGASAGNAPQSSDSIDPATGVPYGQEVGQLGQQLADATARLAAGGQSGSTASAPASHAESPIRKMTPQELHPNLAGRALAAGARLSQPYFVRRGGVIIEYGRSGHEVGAARAPSVAVAKKEIAKKRRRG